MEWLLPEVQGRALSSCFAAPSSRGVVVLSRHLLAPCDLQLPLAGVRCESVSARGIGRASCRVWISPPLPTIPWYTRPRMIAGAIVALAVLITLLSVVSPAFVTTCRRALNHASPALLLTLNIGAIIYAGAPLTFVLPVELPLISVPVCTARLWLQGLGFSVMFGSLFAKTHHVHLIFNDARVVRIRLSARYVLGLLGIAVVRINRRHSALQLALLADRGSTRSLFSL